jgi:hypothetical protein
VPPNFIFRELYGRVYTTTLPDGVVFPWKPLSVGEVVKYTRLFNEGRIPHFVLENEIFRKSVLDKQKVKNLGELKAGTVSIVARSILAGSDVPDLETFNSKLDKSRIALSNEVLHNFVMIICMMFPAYKPEDVYAMDFDTFIERLALAERLQFEKGMREEPIYLRIEGTEEKEEEKKVPKTNPRDLKKKFEEQRGKTTSAEEVLRAHKTEPNRTKHKTSDTVNKSYSSGQNVIITQADTKEHIFSLNGQERQDFDIASAKEMQKMSEIYKPYIDQMKRGEKVKIMTDEERVALHEQRTKENQIKLVEKTKQLREHYKQIESIKPDRTFRFKKKQGV